MGKSDTLDSMDFQTMNVVKSLQQFKDELTILPDKTRLLMKALGPLYTTYLKMDMGLKSIKHTMKGLSGETDEMSETFDEAGEKVGKGTAIMAGGVGLLSKTFSPLVKVLKLTKGLFLGLLMGILPLMGIIFGIMGAVMLLVAVFDKGGGSLRAWLVDLPLIGDAFGVVQEAVDKVKAVFSDLDINMETITGAASELGAKLSEIFGPALTAVWDGLVESAENMKERLLGTWEKIQASVTLPELDGDGMLATVSETLTKIVEFYFKAYNAIYDSIFLLIDTLIEAGLVQTIIDGVMLIYDTFLTVWDLFSWAIGDGSGVGDFIDTVMDIWTGLIDFLVDSGLLDFIFELIGFAMEIVATVVIVSAAIIAVVIKIIAFLYPYVAPYARMVIAYIGFVLTIVIGALRIAMAIFRTIFAVLRGDFDAAGEHIKSIGAIFQDILDGCKSFFKKFVNALIDFISPLFDLINAGIKTFNKIPKVPNLPLINYSAWKMKAGGVMTGPMGGYPVELHGTEAVVPLPDGRSIPVTIEGNVGGGGDATFNINVHGANGDPRKIARMVGEEVGRVFKSRSRGSGFSRGI